MSNWKDYLNMSEEQLNRLHFEAVTRGNHGASSEIWTFKTFNGKKVEVFKGRKVPIGTVGEVFWVRAYDNSKYGDPWGIYTTTKVGIRTQDGETFFTNVGNVRIVAE